MTDEKLTKLAERFCSWPLPPEVCVDSCATIKGDTLQRYGTNLLTVEQAKEMLRHVLREPVADESGGEGDVGFSDQTISLAHAVTTALLPGKGGGLDYWQMRKIVSLAIHDALATPPNPTNGDAVREALAEADDLLRVVYDWINSTVPIPTHAATLRMIEIKGVRDKIATLAKPGGAEG